MDAAKRVFNILGFQYKPLEARFIRDLEATGNQKAVEEYKALSYSQKITVLDKMAALLGY